MDSFLTRSNYTFTPLSVVSRLLAPIMLFSFSDGCLSSSFIAMSVRKNYTFNSFSGTAF